MTQQNDEALMDRVDARTKLAGTNKLELLLFSIGKNTVTGKNEAFGINVFKVKEVIRTPVITAVPDAPRGAVGMVSLRGTVTPVLDMSECLGMSVESDRKMMIVADFNTRTQAFLCDSVETIVRLDWSEIHEPPPMLAGSGSSVTAITQLPDGRIVQVLDVEKVLADLMGENYGFENANFLTSNTGGNEGKRIFFADDGEVARKQIIKVLDKCGLAYEFANNGAEAWRKLDGIANAASVNGRSVKDSIQLVITDIEMPEMDGYMLIQKIKADARFAGVRVLAHSSISGGSSYERVMRVGADGFVPKFKPEELASQIQLQLAA
jgi:two-component system chemotaxis response regulator CheV